MPDLTLPHGYVATLTSRGLSKVTRNGVMVGTEGTGLVDPRWFMGTTPYGQGWLPKLITEAVVCPTCGQVKQTYAGGGFDASVLFTITAKDSDLTIRAAVTNTGTTPWTHVAFAGITFPFTPTEWPVAFAAQIGLPERTRAHLGATPFTTSDGRDGSDYFYPSSVAPIAASAFPDVSCNGGRLTWACWPLQSPSEPFITINSFSGLGQRMIHIFPRRVGPGETAVVSMVYRFASATTDEALWSGYKSTVRAQATMTYVPDVRPIGQFASFDTSNVRPNNPYGYHDGGNPDVLCNTAGQLCRRFDRADGAAQFGATLVPLMEQGRIQGIILWQPQGVHPRSGAYRPDFNSWPQETRALSHTLTDPFRAAQRKIGFQMRPSVTITSSGDARYDAYATASTHPAALAELIRRVEDMVAMGFTPTAYLDSFPARPQDQRIVEALRAHVPGFVGYCEFATMASAPYLGAYGGIYWENGGYRVSGVHPLIRYVYPEIGAAYTTHSAQPPGGINETYQYMLSHRLTPFIPDWQTSSVAAALQPLCDQYINAQNGWK